MVGADPDQTIVVVQSAPDWLDYVAAVSGLLGALLAAGAIVYARHAADKAQREDAAVS